MVHYLNLATNSNHVALYIQADELKKLSYPDVLIRLLLRIEEDLYSKRSIFLRIFRPRSPLKQAMRALRELLHAPSSAKVTEDHHARTNEGFCAGIGFESNKAKLSRDQETSLGRTSTFKEEKLEALERLLADHKDAIIRQLDELHCHHASLLLDDFYLLPRNWQADIIDYIHRLVRDTDLYLKVATIRHRTSLSRNHPQTIGVELSQDVEEINLDKSLDDVDAAEGYLAQMLNKIGNEVSIPEITTSHFNRDTIQALTLASGGVPRDFLTIFVNATEAAIQAGIVERLTPKWVWKGAGRLTYQTKLNHLREDADQSTPGLERVFVDLLRFCIKEKNKTTFLISQDDAQRNPTQHEIIQQLMDMKLVHIVEQDTSAASERPGRHEAYTLDFSLFMEPRPRGLDVSRFWERGEDRHKIGIRESPIYPLERVKIAFESSECVEPERLLKELEVEDDPSAQPKETQDLFREILDESLHSPAKPNPVKRSGGKPRAGLKGSRRDN
ncbi:MAG TPA: hypothetical protein VK181_20680 [Rhizobium sp.]|nr:hypothetical protein [Rhizobium sp.]